MKEQKPWGAAYSDTEIAVVLAMYHNTATVDEIAAALGRSQHSVHVRLCKLRASGRIDGRPRIVGTGQAKSENFSWTPAIQLRDDDRLVTDCLAQGGFPRAVITSHGTAWAGPDGMPWRHNVPKPKGVRRSPMMHVSEPLAAVMAQVEGSARDRLRFVAE